jgi:hypothetical protein
MTHLAHTVIQSLIVFRSRTNNLPQAANLTLAEEPAGAQSNSDPPAVHTQEAVDPDVRGRTNAYHRDKPEPTPTPTMLNIKPLCWVFFAPILDKTPCTITSFCNAVDADLVYKHSKIIWAKASVRNGDVIVVPINNENHLAELRDRPAIGGKFIVVSWVGKTIDKTAGYEAEHHVLSLTPRVITSLFLDTTLIQAGQLMWERGDKPIWGPVTYIGKYAEISHIS